MRKLRTHTRKEASKFFFKTMKLEAGDMKPSLRRRVLLSRHWLAQQDELEQSNG